MIPEPPLTINATLGGHYMAAETLQDESARATTGNRPLGMMRLPSMHEEDCQRAFLAESPNSSLVSGNT